MPRDPEAVVRGFIDVVWNQGQIDRIGEYVAEIYTVDGSSVGREWVAANVTRFRSAFTDVRFELVHLVTDGESRVAGLMRLRALHSGDWNGIPASGQRVEFREAGFWLVEHGKIIAGDFVADTLSLRVRLGQVPESVWQGARMIPVPGE